MLLTLAPSRRSAVIGGGGGGLTGFPNEPGGSTLILDEPWDDVANSGHTPINGWAWGASDQPLFIATNNPGPQTPNNYMGVLFPNGMNCGGAPCQLTRSFSGGEQFHNLYVCAYFKISSPFGLNGVSGTKWMWPSSVGSFTSENYLNFDGANLEVGLAQQGTPDRILGPNNGHNSDAQFNNFLGVWKRVECILGGNSANGVGDGSFNMWVDGVQTHLYTDVNYNMGAARKFLTFRIEPTFGGCPGAPSANPVPQNQWFYWDHLRLSGHA